MNVTLPERASLEHLRGQARALLTEWQSGAKDRILAYFPEDKPNLARSQTVIAREYGFASWAEIRRHVLTESFRRAIRDADVDAAQAAQFEIPSLVNEPIEEGVLPLHLAVENNDADLTRWLIKAGAELEPKFGHSSHTPLSWAITVNSFEAANVLVENGARADLFCLAGLGRLEDVKRFWVDGNLIENPSRTGSSRFNEQGERLPNPPETPTEQISDALYIAARNGHLDVSRWLLEKGADPNFRGYLGGTVLHWAEFSANAELAELVREHGGDDRLEDFEFKANPKAFSIIVPAAWGIPSLLIRNLSAYPDRVDLRGGFGTALNAAVWNGQIDSVRVLLAAGASRTAQNAHGLTAAELARAKGFAEIATLLDVPI